MIKSLKAREILDSRGIPTIEVSLFTEKAGFVSCVPSGSSVGSYEAKELRDGEERYMGKGVLRAVENINKYVAPALQGKDLEPLEIDDTLLQLDGTRDKSHLGANAILGVSMSVFRAAADKEKVALYEYIASRFSFSKSLPLPVFNVINGGMHAGSDLDFQEFMIAPQEKSFAENLRIAVESYYQLKSVLIAKYGKKSINIGDEGGFVPEINNPREALSLLNSLDFSLPLVIDVAASSIFDGEKYRIFDGEKSREEMIRLYQKLAEEFNIIGLEDPLEENDFLGWGELSRVLSNMLIIGDDLLATNTLRMKEARKENSCNAMILKINQIGSITEAVSAAKKAKEFGWKIVVSHRSGETNDDFIADFAVGVGADYIKAGAPARGERVAKYNRLLKIEEETSNNNDNNYDNDNDNDNDRNSQWSTVNSH